MAVRFSKGIALDADSAVKHGSSVLPGEQPAQDPTQSPAIVDAAGLLWCLMHPAKRRKPWQVLQPARASFELYALAIRTRP